MDWDGWVKGVCLFSAFSPPPVVLLSFYTYTMPPPCLSLHLVPLPAYFTFHPSLSIGGGGSPLLLLQFSSLFLPHPDSPFCTSPRFSAFCILPSTILPFVDYPSPLSLSPPSSPPLSLPLSLFIAIILIPLPASQTPPHT